MAKRVQIARLRKGEKRWSLLAHGAAYDRSNAESVRADYESRGDKVRFLTCPD